jgi:hypothetical protein
LALFSGFQKVAEDSHKQTVEADAEQPEYKPIPTVSDY